MTDSDPDLNIILDYRFTEIESELYAVEQHRRALEDQLPAILDSQRLRIRDELKLEYGPEEGELRYQEETWVDVFIDYELPRLIRYPILVSLWAVYESAVFRIAKELQKSRGHAIGLNDLRGGVLERAKKYFEYVLTFPLTATDAELKWVGMLSLIRNAIAHGNGRRDAVRADIWKSIESWNQRGIETDLEYLALSAEFVSEMVEVIDKSLSDLIQRTRDAT